MNRKGSILLILAMTATCGAFAQVYKSVGPDGKIIYTDKPPEDGKGQMVAPAKPASQPTAPSTSGDAKSGSTGAASDAKPMTELERMRIKKANAVKGTTVKPAENPLVPAGRDPAVEKAVIGALGLEDLAVQTEDICQRTLPTSFKKYSTSGPWKQRNATLLAQARRVLADAFDANERQIVLSGVKSRNVEILAPVNAGSMAQKIKWCDNSADEINSGRMDLQNKDYISTPLASYRSKG